MFDPNLQKAMVQEEIGSPTTGVLFQAPADKKIVDLCRCTSELRNLCFSSEENYNGNIERFGKLLKEFMINFGLSEPFKFLHDNFGIYANAGGLQRQYADAVYQLTCTFLTENLSNSMVASDNVLTSIQITPNGISLDLNQDQGFSPEFLNQIKNGSSEVLNRLTRGLSVQEIMLQMRSSLRKTIGYVPPGLGTQNGLPYRGNGITNILVNDFFRINFISDASGHSTISLHSVKQLKNTDRLNRGDRSVISAVYGPSELPLDRNVLDDLFGGDFDFKDLK